VLDSLCRTILSQNTTDKTSAVAFSRLKAAFPTWKKVLASDNSPIEDAIRCGGLAQIKVERIKYILQWILDNRAQHCSKGEPSLEYLRELDTDAVKEELSQFKGVGPKTIACVLMFTLQRAEFPVDTHGKKSQQQLQNNTPAYCVSCPLIAACEPYVSIDCHSTHCTVARSMVHTAGLEQAVI
jgi:endonuclease III